MGFTYHYIERANERLGINAITAQRNIDKASLRGKRADDYTSRERDYLISKGVHNKIAIAYNESCYIFTTDGICLTVYPLPTWFGKKDYFQGKTKIKNIKKYCKHYGYAC